MLLLPSWIPVALVRVSRKDVREQPKDQADYAGEVQGMTATEYYASIRASREAWRASVRQWCMLCDYPWNDLEVHEIQSRSSAPTRWASECNYLLLCGFNGCHAKVQNWSQAAQLALKLVRDPAHFDIQAWLRIRDPELRAPDRVTMAEIAEHLRFQE